MINLTKDNINKAIVNKAFDMVKKNELGYLYTDETICTFNSMLIFKDLFNNKCKMLTPALENLYYIADRIIQCIGPSEVDEFYKVSVITIPDEATATINGVAGKERTLVNGIDVLIVAKLDGYYDKTETIENLSKDEVVRIEFTEEDKLPRYFTINVSTIPTNAICKINGVETKTASLLEGTTCEIEVSADGYISKTTSFVVTNDRNLTISLDKVPDNKITITVNPTPADAVVTIDGAVGNVQQVTVGRHTIKVTKTGFNTYTYSDYFAQDTVLNPQLQITINVTAYPSGCTVTIDGVQRTSANVYPGNHRIVVSKPGYTTYDETEDYQISTNKQVTLQQEVQYCRLTVTATPTPNTITLDGETVNTKLVPAGTRVNIVVTKTDYITYTNTVTVNEDMTVNVVLKNTQDVVFNTVKQDDLEHPRDGVTIQYTIEGDGTVYTAPNDDHIELPINKIIHSIHSATGYTTVTKDRAYEGFYGTHYENTILYPEPVDPPSDFLLTVNTIPADADCTIDGVSGKSQRVSSGNHTVVVSKTGYTTVTRTVNVTTDTEITIELVADNPNVTLTVVATPNDAIVMIDGDAVTSKSVTPGTSHTVVVSKTGYTTYNNVVTVNEDMTLNVTLKNTKSVTFDAYKTDKSSPENRQGVRVQVSWNNGGYTHEDNVPFTLEVPGGTLITIVATAEGYNTETVTRTFTASYDSETVIIPLTPKPVVPKIRIEIDDANYSGGTITMNGVEQKVGYYDQGDTVLIVCTKQDYTPCVIYIRAVEDIVIPLAYSAYASIVNPGEVILRMQAIKQGMIRPISGATFEVDDSITVNTGIEYVTTADTHKIATAVSGYIPESFTYYYQYNADVYFYLASES